jgi:ribonuclease HI
MSRLPKVVIYTDGSCDPNPGPGGWAALLRFGRKEKEISGRESRSTNNRMELTAAIQALRILPTPSRVDLYTDSQYLRRGVTEWMPGWRARNWKRKAGKLANVDLWKALNGAIQPHTINWHWVRGHFLDRNNKRVDSLARRARRAKR